MFPHFGTTNAKGTCIWCGRKLRRQRFHKDNLGDYGDGFFCGLRCGYQFAVQMAELGRRFNAVKNPPKRPPRTRHIYPKCPDCKGKLEKAQWHYLADPSFYTGRCDRCDVSWKYKQVKGTPVHLIKFETDGPLK